MGCVASVSPIFISNGNSQYTDGVPIHSFFDAEKDKERQTGERRFRPLRPIMSLLFFKPQIDVVVEWSHDIHEFLSFDNNLTEYRVTLLRPVEN